VPPIVRPGPYALSPRLIRARPTVLAVQIPPFLPASSDHAYDWRAPVHRSYRVRGRCLVQSTLRVPPVAVEFKGGTTLLKPCAAGIGYLFALAFSRRCCALSSSLAPLRFALFARCFFPFLLSARSFPSHLRRSPPCLLSAILAASSDKSSLTWCAASLVGPHRNLPGRSGQVRVPSMTWSWGNLSSSTRISPTD
jgi:hypothetical protein